ncbi:MAG: glycosyltransferase [Chloroflexi bacterium]|nr:glycosyltransferase [Chloroflexota bacterium]
MTIPTRPSILLLGSQMALAGAQEVLLTQARWFHDQGYPVTAAFFYDRDDLAQAWQAAHPFPVLDLRAWGPGGFLRLPGGLLRLWRLLRRERFAVIETFTPDSNLAGIPLAWLAGVRARVATHHGYIEGTGGLEMRLHGALANSGVAQVMVAVSEQVRALAQRKEGVRPARLRVIENGIRPLEPVSAEARARLRTELAVPQGGLLALTVARFETQKGYVHLLDAIPAALAACPDAVFAFAGEGSLRLEMERKAKSLGIEANLRFLGVRRDVPVLLGAADLFVLPSLWEGLPMALLEAMSLGLACLATDVEGTRDVIRNGYNGRLVPPGDPRALAAALLELLTDAAARARLGAAARQRVLERYSVERMCDEYETLFMNLLKDHP